MEKQELIAKLNHYKEMKQDYEQGSVCLSGELAEKIDMIKKEIEDLQAQLKELELQGEQIIKKDLEKIDHYIELLEMLIEETPDDTPKSEEDNNLIVEDEYKERFDEEEIQDETEVNEAPVSRFPSFNVR